MHPFSEQVLSNRLSALLLGRTPQEARSAIKDQKELVLLRHVFDLTVVHEHDIAELLSSHPERRDLGGAGLVFWHVSHSFTTPSYKR